MSWACGIHYACSVPDSCAPQNLLTPSQIAAERLGWRRCKRFAVRELAILCMDAVAVHSIVTFLLPS